MNNSSRCSLRRQLAAAAQAPPQSIPGVLQLLQTIENTCVDADGLKWFTWLYLQVTQAVEDRVAAGGFNDPAWLSELDVQFAKLYFDALYDALSGAPCPGCWEAMFSCRNQTKICRIQFALAGMNAHINHDLPLAIVATCKATNTIPRHGTAQYNDYTAIDGTLDGLIDAAKQTLNVRLLGYSTLGGLSLGGSGGRVGLGRRPRDVLEHRRESLAGLGPRREDADGHDRRADDRYRKGAAGSGAVSGSERSPGCSRRGTASGMGELHRWLARGALGSVHAKGCQIIAASFRGCTPSRDDRKAVFPASQNTRPHV